MSRDDADYKKRIINKLQSKDTRRLFLPEHYLWEAVLFRAFYDLVGRYPSKAWYWFTSGDSQEVVGSFKFVCMILSIENPSLILQAAKESYEKQTKIFQYPSTRVQHARRDFFLNKEKNKKKVNG